MILVATCHKTVSCVQPETDLIRMETVDRSVHERLFDTLPDMVQTRQDLQTELGGKH